MIRPGEPSDFGRIIADWCRSYRDAAPVKGMADDDYYPAMKARVRGLLEDAGTTISVACDVEDPDTIHGWAVRTGQVLHFVFVRYELRGMGIARALLDGAGVTHYTAKTRTLRRIPAGWAFNPFLFPITEPPAQARSKAA